MANEVVRRKAVEQTVEDINEWVDELYSEINNAKIAVKASGREAKVANDKLDKVTSIAFTRLALLNYLKLRFMRRDLEVYMQACSSPMRRNLSRLLERELNISLVLTWSRQDQKKLCSGWVAHLKK